MRLIEFDGIPLLRNGAQGRFDFGEWEGTSYRFPLTGVSLLLWAALQWNSRYYGRHGGVSGRERRVATEWDV
jgi:hypothetical protein